MTGSLRRVLGVLLLGVLLYAGGVAYSGFQQVRESLTGFRWSAFALALGLASSNYVLRFLKWQYYLGRLGIEQVPRAHSALVFLSGFVLTITPGKLGEVFKSAVLARTHGVPVERTAPIVVAERLTDVMAIVILVLVGSLGFRGGSYWAAFGAGAIALALLLIFWDPPARWLIGGLARWPRLAGLEPALSRAYDSLRILSSPRALGWPVLLSTLGWGLEGFALQLLLEGFGQSPALSFSLFFYATSTLAGALIPVPGGLGITEAMIHEQLVHVGGSPEPVATACMILIRLATLWWAVVVGFMALGVLRLLFPRELGGAQLAALSRSPSARP